MHSVDCMQYCNIYTLLTANYPSKYIKPAPLLSVSMIRKRMVRTSSDYEKRTKLEWNKGIFTELDSFFNQSLPELKYKEDEPAKCNRSLFPRNIKSPSSPSPKSIFRI